MERLQDTGLHGLEFETPAVVPRSPHVLSDSFSSPLPVLSLFWQSCACVCVWEGVTINSAYPSQKWAWLPQYSPESYLTGVYNPASSSSFIAGLLSGSVCVRREVIPAFLFDTLCSCECQNLLDLLSSVLVCMPACLTHCRSHRHIYLHPSQ